MFDRSKMAGAIEDAAGKASTLVVASLAIASCALVVALAALVLAVKARHAG